MTRPKVEQDAEELLVECDALRLPIDLAKISKHLKVRVVEEDLDDDVSGLLVLKNKSAAIAVNREHALNRQRFSVAHEIGHFRLHADKQDVFVDRAHVYYRNKRSATGEEKMEIEANGFAAALLMPTKLLQKDLEDTHGTITDRDISNLANRYGVSEQAMSFRLANLGYIE